MGKCLLFGLTEVQSVSVTVGRFQVTPSLDALTPPVSTASAAAAESSSTPSESSTEEQGESETSLATSLTMSPPEAHPHRGPAGHLREVDGQSGWAASPEPEQTQVEEEEEEEEEGEEEDVEDRQRSKKRNRRRAYSLSLLGTPADSGLSLTAAELDAKLWDGAAGSPQYNALHHLWMMTYSRSTSYLSSDESDSDEEEILEELQELREK